MFSHFFGWTAAIINNSNINEVHTGGGQFFSFSGGRCVGGMIVFCYSHSPTAASLRHRNLKERGGRASLSLSLFLSFPLASLRFGLDFKFTLQEKPSTSIGQIFMVSKMLSCSLSLPLASPDSFVVRSAVVFTAFQRAHISNTSDTLHFIILIAGPRYSNFPLEFHLVDVCIYSDYWMYGATACAFLALSLPTMLVRGSFGK
jgi:hypothetical protein